MIGSLPVLSELHRRGIQKINYPVPATSSALYTQRGDATVVVFNYIDAQHTSDYDASLLGDLLAQIHQQTAQIATPVLAEPFAPPYRVEFEAILARIWAQPDPDSVVLGVQQFLRLYGDEIACDWHAFEEVSENCRAMQFDMLLTHSDAPGNVLQAADGMIYLVDWDEILLAPAERDTWFLAAHPQFLRGYRGRFPNYTPHAGAWRFYLYNRYFEDLLGYVRAALGEHVVADRATILPDLYATCVEWLRPQLRALP